MFILPLGYVSYHFSQKKTHFFNEFFANIVLTPRPSLCGHIHKYNFFFQILSLFAFCCIIILLYETARELWIE